MPLCLDQEVSDPSRRLPLSLLQLVCLFCLQSDLTQPGVSGRAPLHKAALTVKTDTYLHSFLFGLTLPGG